ncbi:heavy metal translocating P-type ATPase [Spongiibacter taiwanensis]|uniref:heavy metal translocating P-type ATPase n=1 Tax=Spongiibacter taiwanensis TaxID=1748242 RepID=UPI002035C864|nr:heavy metal translocating P-type ATPase [Spongiibacter taiwanensis]USA42880.1 heavy metal translocating P-type ATPase [Spongiibacter taiwanensis]
MSSTKQAQIFVSGMRCGSCVSRVERALNAVPGVRRANVNLASEQASIDFDENASWPAVDQALAQVGYHPARQTITLQISGMRCASCVGRIENTLRGLAGVISADVNLASSRATVTVLRGAITADDLLQQLTQAGYPGHVATGAFHADTAGASASMPGLTEAQTLLLAGLLSAPLMVPMLLWPFGIHWMLPGWVQWLLATPVQFYVGLGFYRGALSALRAKTGNMDLLVALGTSTAYGLSVFELLRPMAGGAAGHVYFEAAAVVITLVRLGKWLENRAKSQTNDAIRALQSLRPDTARLLRDGKETRVPLAEVQVGDRVKVLPGEQIPVDGKIIHGASHIDEAMISGESLPVSKGQGDPVIGGTLNGDGMIALDVTAIGSESTLAKIIAMVESAQAAKAEIQRLVDRVSAVFVPIVVVVSLATLGAWLALGASPETAILNAIAVLVIACPCALGLATPAAIMVGTGVAARQGILIRDAHTLEQAEGISTVIFDKTGTLTQGKPQLQDTSAVAISQERALTLAASLQTSSNHPLAIATLAAARQRQLAIPEVSEARTLPGLGIEGKVNGENFALGNRQLMTEYHIDLSALRERADILEAQGKTLCFLARRDDQPAALAMFSFGDTVKADAGNTITRLHRRGITTVMITGDNEGSARHVAQRLGIDQIRANVLPAHKADAVAEFRQRGQRVAMVGDGINDAPALAAADIGIAMASGSDVAMHSAGITLMNNQPARVVDAIDIARRCYRKIRQNLFWAFIYNIVGIPLAAAGLLNPVLAATAMALSSVSVLGNALLLRRWHPSRETPK